LFDERNRRVIIRRDVIFNESDFGTVKCTVVADSYTTEYAPANQAETSNVESAPVELPVSEAVAEALTSSIRQSQRQVNRPDRYGEWTDGAEYDNFVSLDFAEHMLNDDTCHYLYFHNVCEPRTTERRALICG